MTEGLDADFFFDQSFGFRSSSRIKCIAQSNNVCLCYILSDMSSKQS